MPLHGELIVEYRIYSSAGPDIVLNRAQAESVRQALVVALQQKEPTPVKKS